MFLKREENIFMREEKYILQRDDFYSRKKKYFYSEKENIFLQREEDVFIAGGNMFLQREVKYICIAGGRCFYSGGNIFLQREGKYILQREGKYIFMTGGKYLLQRGVDIFIAASKILFFFSNSHCSARKYIIFMKCIYRHVLICNRNGSQNSQRVTDPYFPWGGALKSTPRVKSL